MTAPSVRRGASLTLLLLVLAGFLAMHGLSSGPAHGGDHLLGAPTSAPPAGVAPLVPHGDADRVHVGGPVHAERPGHAGSPAPADATEQPAGADGAGHALAGACAVALVGLAALGAAASLRVLSRAVLTWLSPRQLADLHTRRARGPLPRPPRAPLWISLCVVRV